MEDIRLNLEDGQATVLVMLGFSQAHDLMVCKMKSFQKNSDGFVRLTRRSV
jgi:hypothetical protein